jgi:sugar phosphate isomerase/epimerase
VKTIKGPAIFLAQFAGNGPHLQNFNDMCKWAAGYGYVGVQLPSWDGRVMDLAKAAESKTYCDELKGTAAKHGIEISEISSRCIRRTTCSSTTSRRRKCTATRASGRRGQSSR